MPFYPQVRQHQPGEPIDLSTIQYPISERFTSAFNNTYEHSQYNMIVNNSPRKVTPVEGYPGTFPATADDIEKLKIDRPGLPNIPIGLPKYLADATASIYDNDKSLAEMQEAEPSMLGKIAAFGGSLGASFLDIKALITSFGGAAVGKQAATTIGKWGMAKMGASEIFGGKAANIATQMAQGGITFGAANVGYQASRELQETQTRDIMLQPQNYIQSLKNIGIAGAEGVIAGGVLSGIGIGLLGRRVMRFEDGSYIDMPPIGKEGIYHEPDFVVTPEGEATLNEQAGGRKWKVDREGGLFNRSEFNGMSPAQKKTVADNFKPWTKDADVTMTEDAAGQMMNGQVPDVSPIMKQGIADAGESFRTALREGNIDPEVFDAALGEAHENVKTELAEAIKQSEELRKSTAELQATEKLPLRETADISQSGILKRAELAQFEESIMKQSPELVPENVRKFIETQKEIDRLNRKIEEDKAKQLQAQPEKTAAEVEPNKKVVKRIEALKKRQPKILKPKAELKSLRKQLLDTVGTVEYGQGEAYQRLSELARVWKSAKQLKDNLDMNHNFENKVSELASHDFLISAMRDHINAAHEGATHADLKDYANNLQSTGIPEFVDTATEFEPKPEKDIDAYMQEYSPEEAKSITDRVGNEAYTREVEAAYRKVEQVPKMREMVRNMTDCLMKGAE